MTLVHTLPASGARFIEPKVNGDLQAAIPVTTFAAGVVFLHLVMALLEKKRIENWQEKGEVRSCAWQSPMSNPGGTVFDIVCNPVLVLY